MNMIISVVVLAGLLFGGGATVESSTERSAGGTALCCENLERGCEDCSFKAIRRKRSIACWN